MNRYGRKAIVAAVITFTYPVWMHILIPLFDGTNMTPFGFSYNGFVFFSRSMFFFGFEV